MLAYILAVAVGLGSLAIYLAAFFFPEIHRKSDFYWSGLGLFYALVLWVCAGQIAGGLLLGQIASVVLLGWAVTQTLQLRRGLTPRQQQTEIPSTAELTSTVQRKVSNLSIPERLAQLGGRLGSTAVGVKDQVQQKLGAVTQRRSPKAPVSTGDNKAQVVEPTAPVPTGDKVEEHEQPTPTPVEVPAEIVTTEETQTAVTEEEAITQAVETTQEEGKRAGGAGEAGGE
ncbi:MAG: hypothetical protein JOZ78_22500 [Chroococcidiopsidaceae cyanobacterium CP_BM_ER_R8_30]|nr:hypothetical protein [Chroococcidiopsidaceae cyanobacterium CP_BM_ER_R8_30]